LNDLPEEVQALLDEHELGNKQVLDSIGVSIAHRRDEAKASRKQSGIEDVWLDAEDAYLGIDAANRGEFSKALWMKPTSMDGPITTSRRETGEEVKSTAYVRLTSRYVDAGAAKLGEILLPIDDKSFSIQPTPIPDLIKGKKDLSQVVHNGVPLEKPAAEGQPQRPLTVKDLAEEKSQVAEAKAKAAEKRIYDWMIECQYQSEARKVIFDAARLGVGVLKAPFPKVMRGMSLSKNVLQIKEKIIPAAKWVDAWNVFPDPGCGENIQDGDYIFERDYLSARQLRKLKNLDGYIPEQIDKVLKEGPNKIGIDNPARPEERAEKHRFEVWYYYGTLKREEMEVCRKGSTTDSERQEVYALITLVNDSVIRASINPLDSGEFPYHAVPWQRRSGNWVGVGISEQVRMPQRMVNAATRALLNNAGKSAGCQFIIDQGAIIPADGRWTLLPDKIWYKVADSVSDDVRKAFTSVVIPNMTPQLMSIVEYAFRLAEESTSIPLITQGQSGKTTPDTFGAAQLQNNNANQLLRAIGYSFDEYVTEPVIRQYYEWLLLDPNVPEDEKGDFQINAHGSVALVERAIQDQTIMQMGQMVKDPAFGMDPKKWFKLMAKSKRLDPRELQYSEEEMAELAKQPPPQAPAVQAAAIRAEVDKAKIVASQQDSAEDRKVSLQKVKVDTDRDTVYVQAEQERTRGANEARMREIEVKRELAMLDYANKHQISLENVKAMLAKTAMTLTAQKQLAGIGHAVDLEKHRTPQVAKPAVEPPGRAPTGKAFEL
jgi:hypothetical protein